MKEQNGEEMNEYLYVCNSCQNIHEDETFSCEMCGGTIRTEHKGDLEY